MTDFLTVEFLILLNVLYGVVFFGLVGDDEFTSIK